MRSNRRVLIHRRNGFTLTELLVSMAVLTVLAAMLFPVFRQAIESTKQSHCVQNFKQIGLALRMYQTDYDDRVPPVNYTDVRYGMEGDDRTWVQTLLPYVGHFAPFLCPADVGRHNQPLVPPDPGGPGDPWNRYYNRSLRSNLGYNYLNFSPLLKMATGRWRAYPVKSSQVANPSGTIVFIDSLWDRTDAGMPYGSGSWVTVPPCRYTQENGETVDTFQFASGARFYFGFEPEGWQPESSHSWLVYGGAWPWHRGRFNVLYFDGSAKNISLGQLLEGCDFRPGWEGLITSLEDYRWDLSQ